MAIGSLAGKGKEIGYVVYHDRDFHFTLNVLLLYLVKFKNST